MARSGVIRRTARPPKRRLGAVALVLLASLLLCGIAAPIIVSFGSNTISVRSSDLNAAPRDSFTIDAVTLLGPSNQFSIERGLIFPADANGKPLDTTLKPTRSTAGSGRFVIEDGVLHVQAGQIVPERPSNTSPILDAISNLHFEIIVLRRATVHVTLPDGRTEMVSGINGEITNRRKAALALTGDGDWRGQRINFDIAAGIPTDPQPGTTVPLKVALKSGLLVLNFDGRAGFVGPTQLLGQVDFNVGDVRRLARWFSAQWPTGNELRNLSGRGDLEWAGPALALNRATLVMDENEATGNVHLKLAGLRPSIGGTLALKTLDLGRYFTSQVRQSQETTSNSPWTSLLATDLSLPMLQHFDADLRLSATKVKLGNFQLGRAAAAVTISQGRMLTDVGAFEFDGGRGNGQIAVEMAGDTPKVAVRGRLDDVDSARVLTGMFGHPVVSGRATITTDITGTGRTGEGLRLSANGRVNVAIKNGGRLGVDLRGLAGAAQKRAIDGWGSAGRGQTTFDEFDGSFSLRSGVISADDVKIRSGELSTAFSGTVDLPANRLNMAVTQMPAAPQGPKAAINGAPILSLQNFGPWDKPTSRNNVGRDRAAEPTSARDLGLN